MQTHGFLSYILGKNYRLAGKNIEGLGNYGKHFPLPPPPFPLSSFTVHELRKKDDKYNLSNIYIAEIKRFNSRDCEGRGEGRGTLDTCCFFPPRSPSNYKLYIYQISTLFEKFRRCAHPVFSFSFETWGTKPAALLL